MNETNKERLKKFVESTHELYGRFWGFEQGCKILINSYYGAYGFNRFPFFNKDLAESVTTQGKNAILYAEKNINEFFTNEWSKRGDIHTNMGVKYVADAITRPLVVYCDTDSVVGESLIKCSAYYIKITDENNKDHYLKQTDKVKILDDGVVKVINASAIKENDNILWD